MTNTEILQIAQAVSTEKAIDYGAVISALEEAIRVAARRKYGQEHSIRAEIDRGTGEIRLYREMLVVENVDEELSEEIIEQVGYINKISLEDAKHKDVEADIGDILSEPLPPIDLGRVAAQSAKQVIMYKVKEIERNKQYEEFKDRVGEIINGVVEKIDQYGVLIKVGGAEAVIRKHDLLYSDKLRIGDKFRALLLEVNKDNRGPQIVLTRTHADFVKKLFTQEVPEIYDGSVEIKAVARDAGLRTKIAVFASDKGLDPVGSCVGVRGSRVQAVISELNGEKIDIIPWSADPANLVINALAPASVTKVIIDEKKNRIEAVVPDEHLSIAIGKRGQNVKLASEIVGWTLDVITEEVESKRRNEEFNRLTIKFMEALDVEEILAQLLVSEGYTSVQDLADANLSDLAGIQGLDENISEEIISRAQSYAATHEDASITVLSDDPELRKIDPAIMALEGISNEMAILLYQHDIKTIMDLADLSHDDFIEQFPKSGLDDQQINSIIMAARKVAY